MPRRRARPRSAGGSCLAGHELGLGFRVCGLGFTASGLGFRASGLGRRV